MITEARQLLIDEILNGPLEMTSMGPLRVEDKCCFHGIVCEAYRKATGQGQWLPCTIFSQQEQVFLLDGQHVSWAPKVARDFFGLGHVDEPVTVLERLAADGKDLRQGMVDYINTLPV